MYQSSFQEFERMYQAEEKLWWYRILHEKVLEQIQTNYPDMKHISILDVGCGTGGLLSFLQKKGYSKTFGIDYSEASIHFSKKRNLNVQHGNITDLLEIIGGQTFDVIICNDVLYCLEENQMKNVVLDIAKSLNKGGFFITNNNAFTVFRGTHDIAINGKRRFNLSDFQILIKDTPLKMGVNSYWSLFISPLILAVRLWQQFQIKYKLVDLKTIQSDVKLPHRFINNLLYKLVKFECKIFKNGFFGSSLFLTFQKQ